MDKYRAGALQRELAEAYGIERRTAMEIIRRHGAQRQLGLSDPQIDEVVARYNRGESLAVIGHAFSVAGDTIKRRLIDRGVAIRNPSGTPHATDAPWPRDTEVMPPV